MRYAFCEKLTSLAQKDKNIILLTGDLGYTVFEDFAKKCPRQFFNVGVAESNLMGIASGLALSGKVVFAYSIATFATYRPFEFIRNDICLPKAPVVIVGSGSGYSYGDAGPTHHSLEDIAVMRSLPNMSILAPADPFEAKWATEAAAKMRSPVYLRLGKKGEPKMYKQAPKLKVGKMSWLKKGPKFSVFVTGSIISNVLEAMEILERDGVRGSLASVHTIKPIDHDTIIKASIGTKNIISVEEHRKIGGLGSAVAEVLSQYGGVGARHLILGIDDYFEKKLGNQNYMRKLSNLSAEKIASNIRTFIASNKLK